MWSILFIIKLQSYHHSSRRDDIRQLVGRLMTLHHGSLLLNWTREEDGGGGVGGTGSILARGGAAEI